LATRNQVARVYPHIIHFRPVRGVDVTLDSLICRRPTDARNMLERPSIIRLESRLRLREDADVNRMRRAARRKKSVKTLSRIIAARGCRR
jgi:hypothetical protein